MFKNKISVGGRVIGRGEPLFVIAEVGNQCNYDMDTTKKLIDVCAEAKADAIKFFFWYPDEIMADKTLLYQYEGANGMVEENMFDMLSRFKFTDDEWYEVKKYCDSKNIIFSSTIISPSGYDLAQGLNMELYKISSWDYGFTDLWKWCALSMKPVIFDTGPIKPSEIGKHLQILDDAGNNEVVALHCFHTKRYEAMNMLSIPYMRRAFNVPVGYSSAGRENETDIMAIALGAVVLEKRVTLSRADNVLHSAVSLEPQEFINYVKLMRDCQQAMGKYDLIPSAEDIAGKKKWFRRIVADKDINKGEKVLRMHLEAKRGLSGISPEYMDIMSGRMATRDIKRNETIRWEDLK